MSCHQVLFLRNTELTVIIFICYVILSELSYRLRVDLIFLNIRMCITKKSCGLICSLQSLPEISSTLPKQGL